MPEFSDQEVPIRRTNCSTTYCINGTLRKNAWVSRSTLEYSRSWRASPNRSTELFRRRQVLSAITVSDDSPHFTGSCGPVAQPYAPVPCGHTTLTIRSEEHTSELQS